jgi:hypothetical protein
MEEIDSTPVARLLELGEPGYARGILWPDYRALGLGEEHIPQLIEIATNLTWINLPDDHDPLGWAPVHAWRALGQLEAVDAVMPLMQLFHEIRDNDWVIEELPDVFAEIGPASLAPLVGYLGDAQYPAFARMIAATSLMQLAVNYPDLRDTVLDALAEQLQRYPHNTTGMNSVLIARLVALDAAEYQNLIHEVFQESTVDRFITGDWRDIKKRFARIGETR